MYTHYLTTQAIPGDNSADSLLVRGDRMAAIQRYVSEIQCDPVRTEQWSGLALALMDPDRYTALVDPAIQSLQKCPELVAELYRQLYTLTSRVHDPLKVARWLAPLPKPTIQYPEANVYG